MDYDLRGPTPHLSWAELACKDGTPYPERWKQTRAVRLAEAFERLRERCGGAPIYVSSGYRTPPWNARVGGSRNSQHIQGVALDLLPPVGLDFIRFVQLAFDEAREAKLIRGVGVYATWLHIDCRDSTRLAAWRGSRVSPEMVKL